MADVLYAQNDKGEKLAYINGQWVPAPGSMVAGLGEKLKEAAGNIPILSDIAGFQGKVIEKFFPQIMAATSGETLGFADEALAYKMAQSDVASGKANNFDEAYKNRYQQINSEMQAYRQINPSTSTALELAGGLLTGGIGAGRAAGLTGVKRLAALAGTGVGYGGLAGAGYSQPGERMKGAGEGMLTGGMLSLAVPMVAQGVRGALRKASGAGDMLSAKGRAGMYLGKQLEESGMTPQQLQARMARYGEGTMYADIPAFQPAVQTLGTQPVKGAKQLSSILTKRDLTRNKRVVGNISRALGADDIYAVADDIAAKQKQLVAPLYEKAYKQKVPLTKNLKDYLSRPSSIDAWKSAQRLAADEGIDLPQVISMVDGKAKIVTAPDMKTWDYIKRGLDTIIDKETDSVTGKMSNQGRVIQNLKRSILNELDNISPDYKQARMIFSNEAANSKALDLGLKSLKEDAYISAKIIRRMSETEKEMYRLGQAKALKDKVLGSPEGADAWKRIMGNELLRERIKVGFPDRASYMAFKNMMRKEAIYSTTKGVMRGGSNTAQKLANIENAGQLLDVLQSNRGVVDRTVTALVNWAKKKFFLNPETMNEVANMLKSDLSNPEFINLLMKKSAALGKDSRQLISQLIAMAITRETLKSMPGE